MVHSLLLISEKMEVNKHCIFLIIAIVIPQAACRICPPGELEYTDKDTALCCKPKILCKEGTYVTKCTTNHTTEKCRKCPQGKTLAYESSSFDRKICYDIPRNGPCNSLLPDIKAINATTCACNWSNGLFHEEPDNNILDPFNCQFREKSCSSGTEPIVDGNGCNKCKHGFYQDADSYKMCMRWKNCTALDLGVSETGTDKHDAVCISNLTTTSPPTVHTVTTSTTDNTTGTVEITSTTLRPPRTPPPDPPPDPPQDPHTLGIIIGVIAIAVTVTVVVITYICWKKRRPPRGDPESSPEQIELMSGDYSGSTVQTLVGDTSTDPQRPSSNGTIPKRIVASNGKALREGDENGLALFSKVSMLPQDQSELSDVDNPNDRGLQTVPKQTDASPFANTTRKTIDIDENNPQTVPKLVDNRGKYPPPSGAQPGTSGDDTKTKSTSSDGGESSENQVLIRQVSNVSGHLPDGPITGETSKKCAVVNPVLSQQSTGHGREGEENTDNSISMPSHVTSSPVRSSMPTGDNGAVPQQAVSPCPSFQPPLLRDGGSLSEESARLNSR